jgi:two-component system LytT family response regulator
VQRIRTLIVDDEPLAREGIRVLLEKCPDFEIIGECGNGASAVEAIHRDGPDLLFLDVQMPRMNGFGVLRELDPDRIPVVVFVTAYDQYAIQAFEHHALDYLLKPFDDERFERTLSRVRTRIQQQDAHRLSRRMLELLGSGEGPDVEPIAQSRSRYLGRLSIKSAGRVLFLDTSEIDWIEAADYYVKLHVGGKSHLLRETMNNLEDRLDPALFMRIHRSTMVNLNRIQELRTSAHGEHAVLLGDGTQLRLSRSRRDGLKSRLATRD